MAAIHRVRLQRLARWSLVLLAAASGPAPASAQDAPDDAAMATALALQSAYERVAAAAFESVVAITAYRRVDEDAAAAAPRAGWRTADEDRYPGYRRQRAGSGFVVSADGFLFTAYDVLTDPETGEELDLIDVEIHRRHLRARLVGAEPNLDLAVIKIEPPLPLRPITIADADAVRVGHLVVALGDPDGAERTFVPGVVSGQPERECYQDQLSATLIQTTAPVHPEAFGGPLVDIRGRVIGINRPPGVAASPIAPGGYAGVGYALPINLAMTLYEPLVALESKRSPWLGIAVLPMSKPLRERIGDDEVTGIYIDSLFDPSPASRADIRVGDVLAKLDGEPVFSVQAFQRWLYFAGVGKPVRVVVFRDGEYLEKDLVIEQRPPEAVPR